MSQTWKPPAWANVNLDTEVLCRIAPIVYVAAKDQIADSCEVAGLAAEIACYFQRLYWSPDRGFWEYQATLKDGLDFILACDNLVNEVFDTHSPATYRMDGSSCDAVMKALGVKGFSYQVVTVYESDLAEPGDSQAIAEPVYYNLTELDFEIAKAVAQKMAGESKRLVCVCVYRRMLDGRCMYSHDVWRSDVK